MLSDRPQYRKLPYREKRKDRRVLFPPVTIRVDGKSFETANWSFGGFRVENCDIDLGFGETIKGSLGWSGVRFPFVGRVSRCGGEMRELAVGFTDVSDAALMFLDHRLSDYLSQKRPKT